MENTSWDATIRTLCEATGIADSHQVVQTGHMAVNERTVGLINEPETGDLLIFVDCGDAFESRDADVFRRMLRANVACLELFGSFGLHPETGAVVYRMRLTSQAPLDGHALASLIATQVELAAATLETIRES